MTARPGATRRTWQHRALDPGRRHPVLVVVLVVATAAGSLALVPTVRIDSDALALMPADNHVVRTFRRTLEQFGTLDLMLVAVRSPDAASLQPTLEFVDLLAGEIRAVDSVEWLEYHRDDLLSTLTAVLPSAPLYLAESDLRSVLSTLGSEEALDRLARELAADLRLPTAPATKRLHRLDPIGIVPKAFGDLTASAELSRFRHPSGFLVDQGERYVLLIVKPTRPPADIDFSRGLVTGINHATSRAADRWAREGSDKAHTPTLTLVGAHATTVRDAELIRRDLRSSSVTALVAVAVLFAVAIRRLTAVTAAFVPLFVGLALTFGLVALTFGRLNAVTAAFAALLIGLGIDFVIVIYARYAEERQAGVDHKRALELCGRHTVPSVVLGATTTAVTFFALLVSDFTGLYELGLLTGAGILLVAICVFLLLPAILTLLERGVSRPRRIRTLGSTAILSWSYRHPRAMLALNLAATAALALASLGVRFDDDASSLRGDAAADTLSRREIRAAFDLHRNPYLVRVDGSTEVEALRRARELEPQLRDLVAQGQLARVESVLSWVPPVEAQKRNIKLLQAFQPGRPIAAALSEALEEAGLKPAAFAGGIRNLELSLALDAPRGATELGLGRALGRYLAATDTGFATLLYAYPPSSPSQPSPPDALVEIVEASPWAELTGPVVVSNQLRRVVWRDVFRAGTVGTLLVLLLLALNLGGIRHALVALLPLTLGLIWMVGWMALVDVPLNFLNLFVFVMLLGIGVDYGIHLLHRWQESRGDIEMVLGLAPAIAVAALTTALGFGSLALSRFPGLRSMGLAAIFGVLSMAWLSLTLLPALAAIVQPSTGAERE